MGFIRKAVQVAKVVTNTDIPSATTSCQGCGKTINGNKRTFCSDKCVEFYGVGKWGKSNY
jgi:hypothetical protein